MPEKAKGGKGKGIVVVRSKKVFVLPTGQLHYAQMTKPDEEYDKFSVSVVYTPEELDAVASTIQTRCIDFLLDDFNESAKNPPAPVSAKAWLEERLKETTDGTTRFVRFDSKASFEWDGKTIHKTMSAWDAKNNRLDLAALRLGRGSRIQVVLKPALTMGGLGPKVPSPKLELVGVRVIKLIQYGGATLDAVDEAEISEADDLSSFAGGSNKPQVRDVPETAAEDDPF